jgi:hypothetical protein
MEADRRIERRAAGELLIYPARRRLLLWASLGLAFTIGGIWMLLWADPTTFIRSKGTIKAMGAFATLFFGGGTIFFAGRAASRRPIVIINDEGITSRETLYQLPFIRWEEITGVSIEEELGHRRLRFDLRDPETVIQRCASPISRNFHTRMLQSGRSILNVSEDQAAIPLDELQEEVETHLT